MPRYGRPSRLVLLLVLAFALGAPAGASAFEPRIIAGHNVQIEDHPYQVLVTHDGFICGGSIRDATHVVTAAHCVVNEEFFFPFIVQPQSVAIRYGDEDQDKLKSVGVSQVSVFPAYLRDPRSAEFDVAVLTLATPIDLSLATAKAISFASPSEFTSALGTGGPAFVTGWGVTDENGQSSSRFLQGVSLPLRDAAPCLAVYGGPSEPGGYNSDVMICAGGGTAASDNPDACQGDSGGPLVIDTDPTSATFYELIGIVSFGIGCGRTNVPGAYAWVQSPVLRPFLETATPAAPPSPPATNPTISGTPRVGSVLTCNAPPLAGSQVTAYIWSVFEPTSNDFTAVALSAGPNLTLPANSFGARLVCDARYENAGGFTYTDTPGSAAVGPVLAAPAPPVTPTPTPTPTPAPTIVPPDTTRPRARIVKVACRRGKCTMSVRTSDVGGLVRSLSAKLTFKVRRCRTVGGRRRCRAVSRTRKLRPRKTGTGFTITTRLKPGRYTLSAVATDTSGNRSRTAVKRFRVRRR